MADAGKIVITPKGAYSSTTTYEWLDEVSYDGRAYIALKTVTGVTPSDDGENWRLFLDPADVNANTLVPTFEEQSARNNIISGDNISTLFGKVKKWFTDLKSHAFNDTVNNLTTEATGSALDASQGKVLQDEVEEINSNLGDYGLNAIPTDLENGVISESGEFVNSNSNARDKSFRSCNANDSITVISQTICYWIGIACYKEDGTFLSLVKTENGGLTKATLTTPTDTAKYKVVLSLYSNMTPSQIGRVVSYVNNSIDEIKNDLDKLNSLPKGTIIQIEADKDTINTTKEKYGWQYLGTSSIEYDNGSYVSMATNVYRKNN